MMTRLLIASRDADRTCLMYLHAQDGSGRFSLASQFFYENRQLFDDYIEIAARQADGRLMPQGEMLGQALRGLGLADTELPSTELARADAFQRLSTGRRFLMVIKDVASTEQVRLLMPTSSGAAVVVTTRVNLRELLQYDFTAIAVDRLPADAARELMTDVLGDTAARITADVRERLLALCEGYPLLIRVIASQVKDRPHVAGRFVDDAAATGGSLLAVDFSKRISMSLEQASDELPEELRPAYRMLSLLPGPDFSVEAAGAALSCSPESAVRLLDDLVDANLLQIGDGSERYAFHGVLRRDARSRALSIDGQAACDAIVGRVVDWYLEQAVLNDAAIADRWRVGAAFEARGESGRPIPERTEALEWFGVEWPNVVASVKAAQDVTAHAVAVQLCVSAFKYLHQRGHYDAWLDSHRTGLQSAEILGDVEAVMQLSSQRGAAHLGLGQLSEAEADFEQSLECAVSVDHRLGEQSAQEWLGKVAAKSGDTVEALRRFAESEAVIERSGSLISVEQQARMRGLLGLQRGRVFLAQGVLGQAANSLLKALGYFDAQCREPDNRAKALALLGEVRALDGQAAEAVGLFEEAARLFQGDGLLRAEGNTRHRLADVLAAAGDVSSAVSAYREAFELFIKTADPEADAVRAKLESLSS